MRFLLGDWALYLTHDRRSTSLDLILQVQYWSCPAGLPFPICMCLNNLLYSALCNTDLSLLLSSKRWAPGVKTTQSQLK